MERNLVVIHSQEDSQTGTRVVADLASAGYYVLPFTEEVPPDDVRRHVHHNLGPGDFILLLLSRSFVKSSWLKDVHEFLNAEVSQRSISVLPVMLERLRIPTYLQRYYPLNISSDKEKGLRTLRARLSIAKDFNLRSLGPEAFERLTYELLKAYGFKEIKRRHEESGYDATAKYERKDPFGRSLVETWLVQVKAQTASDVRMLSSLLGQALMSDEPKNALFITAGQLTSAAREWLSHAVSNKPVSLRVIERDELQQLLLANPKLMEKYFADQTRGGAHA